MRGVQVRSTSVIKHTPVRPGLIRRQLGDEEDDDIIETSDTLRRAYASQAEEIWQDDAIFYGSDARNGSNASGEYHAGPYTTTTSTTVSWSRKNTTNATLNISMIAGVMKFHCSNGEEFMTSQEAQMAFKCAFSVLAEVKCESVDAHFNVETLTADKPDEVIVDWAIDEDSNNASDTIDRITKTQPDEVEDIMADFFDYFADGTMRLEPEIASLRVDGYGGWDKSAAAGLAEEVSEKAEKSHKGRAPGHTKSRGLHMSGTGEGHEPVNDAMPALA